MGLALTVGYLADQKTHDPEVSDRSTGYFEAVNELLKLNDLPVHNEPLNIASWDAEMWGYSGLHHLRRLAAYVDCGAALPAPGNDDNMDDDTLDRYFDDVTGERPGFLQSMFRKKQTFHRAFDHLIVHSDAEGVYLPIDFPDVLIASEDLAVPGAMVGSVPRLLDECDRIAGIIEIPTDLTAASDDLWAAAESQGQGTAAWQQYGVESYSCVTLRDACKKSLETGAAIVFT